MNYTMVTNRDMRGLPNPPGPVFEIGELYSNQQALLPPRSFGWSHALLAFFLL